MHVKRARLDQNSWQNDSHFSRSSQSSPANHCPLPTGTRFSGHQVSEILRQPAIDAGTFDKVRDTQIWPLPENVGIVLDRDDGLLVKSVQDNSAAVAAGIRGGDSLAAGGGRKLFGQGEFRGILL